MKLAYVNLLVDDRNGSCSKLNDKLQKDLKYTLVFVDCYYWF